MDKQTYDVFYGNGIKQIALLKSKIVQNARQLEYTPDDLVLLEQQVDLQFRLELIEQSFREVIFKINKTGLS